MGFVAVAVAGLRAQEKAMTHHVSGTFDVKVTPIADAGDGLSRYGMEKQYHGAFEGTSKGEMIGGGDYKAGNAGYVAAEILTGTLDGKHGSFGLQHMTTMIGGKPDMKIIVIPGSGTEELAGIAGTFQIIIEQGKHSYDFDYTLPTGK
jgi:hypothetical protein